MFAFLMLLVFIISAIKLSSPVETVEHVVKFCRCVHKFYLSALSLYECKHLVTSQTTDS